MNGRKKQLVFSLLALLLSISAYGSWNDPTLVLQKNKIKLGETLNVDFYNAPSNAGIAVCTPTGSIASAVLKTSISNGTGEATLTIPETAGKHLFNIVMYTGTTLLSEPVYVLVDNTESTFSMSTNEKAYTTGADITITYKNAPALKGDRIVMYPEKYKLVPSGSSEFVSPAASADITETDGTVILRTTTNSDYNIYYVHEGTYVSLFEKTSVVVGSTVKLSLSKTSFIEEEDIPITYTGFSKQKGGWIGVFSLVSNLKTSEPFYTIDIEGSSSGKVTIPASTLESGKYRIVAFSKGTRNVLTSETMRLTIYSGNGSLIYSDNATETYYRIISALDGKCMSTKAFANSNSAEKQLKLEDLDEESDYFLWKLVKREDGKTEIINKATGEFLLSTSEALSNFNYSKVGVPTENNNGHTFSYLGDDQYTIKGVEDDGVTRYLANITSGGDPLPLNLTANSEFAWKLNFVETVVTGINGVNTEKETVTIQDKKIIVTGDQNYTLWDANGKQHNKQAQLIPGIYLVKWTDGRNVKVIVK